MANHFISINRGESGFASSDFTTGAASTAGDDIELRIADGASLTRKDLILALKAFERVFESGALITNFPVL